MSAAGDPDAGWLLRRFALGYARMQPWRAAIQITAIATGVALGYAVHLINAAALDELSAAERSLSGTADLAVVAGETGFDEQWYARVAADPRVALAAPALEIDATVIDNAPRPRDAASGAAMISATDPASGTTPGASSAAASGASFAAASGAASGAAPGTPIDAAPRRGTALRIVGIDVLRSALVNPDLVGVPGPPGSAAARGAPGPLLDGGLYLSAAALARLHRAVGESIAVVAGDHRLTLAIAGTLPAARGAIGAMDLGFAQWRFERLGRLSRIDVKFVPGTASADMAAAQRAWALPPALRIEQAQTAIARDQGLSRSYRVNLDVLSLVALFTGGFLIFSLQSQAIVARRAPLALLRMLGATRGVISRMLIAEALVLGTAGAVLGLASGAALAALALRTLGGDLGGGYFSRVPAHVAIAPGSALLFFLLGLAAALGGAWLPALEAGAQAPAPALKAGVDPAPASQRPRAWTALAGYALAAALVAAPPVGGMPLGAYAAIALLLVSTIALKPLLAPPLFGAVARAVARRPALTRHAAAWLAATRLARLPRFAAVGAAGIVASFALMVAMATMVGSFRGSFDNWLSQVLAADLYVRAAPAGTTARFADTDLDMLRADRDIVRAEFSRLQSLVLDAARAPVALIARPLTQEQAAARLPLIGDTVAVAAPAVPVWISEAVADLYDVRPGATLLLPLGPAAAPGDGTRRAAAMPAPQGTAAAAARHDGERSPVIVAGIWRDYARQGGSIVIGSDDFERLSGDTTRTDAALWLRPGADASGVAARLAGTLAAPAAQIVQPGQIRAISLRLFDRSFQVTYLLEWAAIVIGLAGLATTFSAQAIARTREFGMLRHLGVTRGQVLALLASEAVLVTLLAAALGLGAGLGIAEILVRVVNPQSFHWTMELRVPALRLFTLSAVLLLAAAAASTLAGRRALSVDTVRAVRKLDRRTRSAAPPAAGRRRPAGCPARRRPGRAPGRRRQRARAAGAGVSARFRGAPGHAHRMVVSHRPPRCTS